MALLAINVDGGQTDAGLSLAPFGALFPSSAAVTSGSLQVSAQTSPDMSVKVRGSDNDDAVIIKTSSGATYYIKNTDPNESVTILANASGVTKTDAIVLYVDLTAGDPDNAGSPGAAQLIAVRRDGTNTGAPTTGEIDAATNNNPWYKLGQVEVANGASSITSGNITDTRSQAKIWIPAGDSTVTTPAIVDGAVTEAKSAVKNSFTTSEVNTGYTWIDGSAIYKKTLSIGSLPNNTAKSVAHGVTGLDKVIHFEGWATATTYHIPLPYSSSVAANNVSVAKNGANIEIGTGNDRTSWTGYVTIYYTKT